MSLFGYRPSTRDRLFRRARPDGGFWFIFVAIAQVIWTGIQIAAVAVAKIAIFIAHYVLIGLRAVWEVIKAIKDVAVLIGTKVYEAVRWMWANVIRPLATVLSRTIERVSEWLKNLFQPVLEWANRVNQWLDKIYDRYLRPILNWLEISRNVLKLLAAVGVEWARKLEEILWRVESGIYNVWTQIRDRVNQVITYIELLQDPFGFIKQKVLLSSIGRVIRQVVGIAVNAGAAPQLVRLQRQKMAGRKTFDMPEEVQRFRAGEFTQSKPVLQAMQTFREVSRG